MKYKLKISAIMMALIFLVGCTSGTNEGIKPGTYEGVAKGFGGDLTVSVEVDETSIKSISIKDHSESPGISDPAIESIPQKIVENQSIMVDAISGATYTSEAIKEATKAALLKATDDISMFEKEIAKETGSKELIVKEADVVIIGAGGAGLTAANEALDLGASVIVLEKQPAVGGNTILAGSAMNTSNPDTQKDLTMTDSEKNTVEKFLKLEAKNEIMQGWLDTLQKEWDAYKTASSAYLFDSPSLHKLQTYVDGDYVADPALVDILGENSLDALHYMEGKGTKWQDTANAAVGATWRRSHTPTTEGGLKGAQFVMPQYNYAVEKGAEIILEAKVESLIMEDNRCVGVKGVKADGQPFEIRANKGVIVATGGFSANVEMRQKYNTKWANLDESVPTSNGPQATGDGLVMAEAVGAKLRDLDKIQILPTWGGTITTYIENQIYVNQNGERFVKEDGRRDELSSAILEQPGSYCYIVNDSKIVDEKGFTVVGKNVNEMVEKGQLLKGETVAELAEKIGCSPETLQVSIDEFNKAVEEGQDKYGRAVFDQKIDKGPFYAGKTSPAVHHTMGGISINTNAEALDKDGNVIEGLFAAGEVTGGIHGGNRLGGNAITDIAVFGRIAGTSAANNN